MKKKHESDGPGLISSSVFKILRVMKLMMVLICFIGLLSSFGKSYSQNTKLSVEFKNSSIESVLNYIESSTEYSFMYDNKKIDISREVNISAKDQTVEAILDQLFENEVNYKMIGKHIIITPREEQLSIASEQQQKSISGKVTDSSGGSLPGVSVVVKGTTKGSITDSNGNYTLSNVSDDATLQFTFIGMKSQEFVVGNKATINVTLEEEAVGIEEVVAIGYGTQKKVNLTGAVSSVDSKVLESRPIVNLGQGLQGVVPNLNISFGNGAPGKAADFNIRGDNSINGGSPLVLIDGVQMDISLINPSDIESISVLKDGSSAAIYGARAGYGVILIKTKSGGKNKAPQISYDGNFSVNSLAIIPEQMESLDFVNYKNTATMNAGAGAYYSEEFINHVKNYLANPTPENSVFTPEPTTNDPGRYGYCANTDWFRASNKERATSSQHSIGISGGTENSSYYGSVSYMDQGGFLRYFDDSYKRINAVVNIESDINKWLTAFAKMSFNNNSRKTPYSKWGSLDNEVFSTNAEPLMPVYHPDGNHSGQGWWSNFVAIQKEAGSNTNEVNDSWLTGGLKVKPFEKLIVNFDYSYNYYVNDVDVYSRSFYDHYADPNRATLFPHTTPNFAQQIQNTNKYQALNLFAQYDNKIGKSMISAIVGFNQEDKSMVGLSAKREELINNEFPSIRQATGYQSVDESNSEWAIRGTFFRLNYSFAEKYLLEFDGRYDGSSRFQKDSRFDFFPSGSAAWRISKESFFEPFAYIVNELKLRASYSNLGNQNLGSNYYPSIATLGSTAQINYIIDGKRPLAVTAPGLVSAGLKWETVNQFNIGLDFGLLQNKLTGSLDIYKRSTLDMLTSGQLLPAVLGTAVPQENAADMKTNGFEFSLKWKDKIGNLSYFINTSLSDYQSEITRFVNPQKTLGSYYVGQKIGEIWGYQSNGLFQTQAEVDAAPSQSMIWGGAWAPGDVKYEDMDKSGTVNNGKNTVDDHGDLSIIGNSTPRYQFSLSGGLEWQNFDFNFIIQGIAKRDAWIGGQQFWGFIQTYDAIPKTVLDSWSTTNTDAYFPRPYIYFGHNNQVSSRYLQDASYLRIKNMTLGYTLPKNLTQKIKMGRLRFYMSVENLITFTKLNKNFDPEIVYNAYAYPTQQAISFGINAKF